MNGNPTPESSELIPYIKERKRTGAQKIIFLIAIIGIIAAICITLIKSSGGFLSGLFGKSAETTTSAPETTTSPSQKENIYDYDPSAVPEGKKGVIPADLSAEKQGRRFSSDGDISHDSSFLQKVTENKISVLIVCTHPYESYSESNLFSYGDDFYPIGGEATVDALARELTVSLLSLGVGAEYLDTGITSAKGSYAAAQEKIEDYLKTHPDIVYIIDLHRGVISDSNDNLLCPITEKDGDIYAQMSFTVGTVDGKPSESLPTVNALFDVISERFPSLIMPIETDDALICQQLAPTVITLEIGSCANTYSSAENTAKYFAFIFSESVKP